MHERHDGSRPDQSLEPEQRHGLHPAQRPAPETRGESAEEDMNEDEEGLDYFHSITLEFQALKDRVRHFIRAQHWLTDGEWKESVLRAVLRRHLPQNIGVGKGFVITKDGPSSQIDILLFDRTKPLLYQDGDLVIVTPDLCMGVIEVKTRLDPTKLRQAIQKLSDCRDYVSNFQCRPFVGLFSFEHEGEDFQTLLNNIKTAAAGSRHRVLSCVSLGTSLFARYWWAAPERPNFSADIVRAYKLQDLAPAYFVHNVIEALCQQSVLDNNHIWYPAQGKEAYTLGQIALAD